MNTTLADALSKAVQKDVEKIIRQPKTGIKRNYEFCTYAECQPILNLLQNELGTGVNEAFELIGYSRSMATAIRNDGKVRVSTKYALLGLYHELGGKVAALPKADEFTINYDETVALFEIIGNHVRSTPRLRELAGDLLKRLALHMVEVMPKAKG